MRPSARARDLRVALLCHYPDDDKAPAGGVWAVGRNLAAGMVAAGVEVHVVRYRPALGAPQPPTIARAGPALTVHTVWVPRTPRHPIRQLAAVNALAAVVSDIEPDAITAHESEYALAALESGWPTAVTVHGIVRREFWSFRNWRSRLSLLPTVWLDWNMARRVEHLVAINRYVIDRYSRRTNAAFYRIDVPIGDIFFQTPEATVEPNTLLLVGGMNERKDPMTLLRALRLLRERLPGVELRIAGRIVRQGFGERLHGYIRDHGLERNVRFVGPLDQPQLAQVYASTALTVLSSRQETSPAVLMEAMATGRPVVATDVGGVREIVADGESGYVVAPQDPVSMADRIEAVLKDEPMAAAMGRRGRELAEARYRRSHVGRQYVALLEYLARAGGG